MHNISGLIQCQQKSTTKVIIFPVKSFEEFMIEVYFILSYKLIGLGFTEALMNAKMKQSRIK